MISLRFIAKIGRRFEPPARVAQPRGGCLNQAGHRAVIQDALFSYPGSSLMNTL
jgi:hypothetical protein